MKTFLVLAITIAVCLANTIPDDNTLGEERSSSYPRFIEMPDGEGQMHTVDLEEQPDPVALDAARNGENNRYWLYTRRNSVLYQTLRINDVNSIRNSNFDFSKPTHIIVHGWLSTGTTEPNPCARRAFLAVEDCNVITVDWRDMASSSYVTAVAGVPDVGRHIGRFLIWLNTMGLPWDNIHLVGFSLGGHVVGSAGRETGGRCARITSLDPAGPLWNHNSNKMNPTAGVYTEAVHTSGGVGGLGIGSRVAQVDFFPNGGSSMPGCYGANCDHFMAFRYYCSSVVNQHMVGIGCTSMTQVTLNTCRGDRLEMGNHFMNKRGSGIFRLTTGRNYPY